MSTFRVTRHRTEAHASVWLSHELCGLAAALEHITHAMEPIMRITTATEYAAAIARKNEIIRQLDECYSTVFDIPHNHPLEIELDRIYADLNLYEEAEIYNSLYPCNF
jgi:hypothetical protein